MRTSTAYFAGVGTVVVAVAAGLGGGYLAANVVSPHEPKYGNETRLERRMASQAIPVTTASPEPVPYVAATTSPVATPAPAEPQTPAKAEQHAAASSAAPAEDKTAGNSAAAQPALSPPSAKPAEQASEKTVVSREAFAKARDADLKRAAREQRHAERRQRWAEKRRLRQPREQELEAVEQKVREETEHRQVFAVEPVRIESSRIRLFNQD